MRLAGLLLLITVFAVGCSATPAVTNTTATPSGGASDAAKSDPADTSTDGDDSTSEATAVEPNAEPVPEAADADNENEIADAGAAAPEPVVTEPETEPVPTPTPRIVAPQPTAVIDNDIGVNCPDEPADFSGLTIVANVFIRDLRCADFSNTTLTQLEFGGAQLDGADFTGARIEAVSFDGVALRRANFTDAVLVGVEFEDSDLTGAVTSGWAIEDTVFEDTICPTGLHSVPEVNGC